MNSNPHTIIVSGAGGRMGRIITHILTTEQMQVYGIYRDPERVTADNTLPPPLPRNYQGVKASALVDFSLPSHLENVLSTAVSLKLPLIIGTTGYTEVQLQQIKEAAKKIPILIAANMSLTFHKFRHIVRKMAETLPTEYDIEIVETHHKNKKDAPSGTALLLLEEIQKERSNTKWLQDRFTNKFSKNQDEIGISSIRSGEDMVGEHRVIFAAQHDRIELMHRSSSPQVYAAAIPQIINWCTLQPPGLYTMDHVTKSL